MTGPAITPAVVTQRLHTGHITGTALRKRGITTITDVTCFDDGTTRYTETIETNTVVYRRTVVVPAWEETVTACFCCSCTERTTDLYCRNHGALGKRPCDTHNMYGHEFDNEGEELLSVQEHLSVPAARAALHGEWDKITIASPSQFDHKGYPAKAWAREAPKSADQPNLIPDDLRDDWGQRWTSWYSGVNGPQVIIDDGQDSVTIKVSHDSLANEIATLHEFSAGKRPVTDLSYWFVNAHVKRKVRRRKSLNPDIMFTKIPGTFYGKLEDVPVQYQDLIFEMLARARHVWLQLSKEEKQAHKVASGTQLASRT